MGRMPPAVAVIVLERDDGCVANRLDPDAGPCSGRITLEHVHSGYGKMGRRAPSDPQHLVSLCWAHGVQSWELTHKALTREYLRQLYPEAT